MRAVAARRAGEALMTSEYLPLLLRPRSILALAVFCFCLSWAVAPSLAGHGLRALYGDEPPVIDRVVFLTSNDLGFQPEVKASVRWTGFLYQPRAGHVEFAVPAGVQSRLVVGENIVFDQLNGTAPPAWAGVHLVAGFNPIEFVLATDGVAAGYMQAGLEWRGLGRTLVPAVYLYPDIISATQAERALQAAWVSAALGLVACGLACWWAGAVLWAMRRRLWSRTALGLSALVAFAFLLRLVFLFDYAAQPAADVLSGGTDHRGYQGAALDYVRGRWPPPKPFYVQPGMSLFLGVLYASVAPSLRLVQLVQMLLGAFTVLVVFEITRRAFDDQTAWLAAGLWAFFPLSIFYEAQLTTHGLEPALGALLLLLWIVALQIQAAVIPRYSVVFMLGLALGVSALIRPTFLILAPLMFASLLLARAASWRAGLAAGMLLAVATCIPIAPVTWHNYQANGQFQLLTSNSAVTFYLGNNRDSTGLAEYSPAFNAAHYLVGGGKSTYMALAAQDIRGDPVRWVRLMVRKTALYFGNAELPNNVDFYREGVAISALLGWLPLRFGAMLALASAGLWFALRHAAGSASAWRMRLVLLVYALTQAGVVIVYHVFGRLRAPIYPVLAILGAVPLSIMLSAMRQRNWRSLLVAGGLVFVAGAGVAVMPVIAEGVMTAPLVAAVPATARAVNTPMGEGIGLAGYEPLLAVAPGDPLLVTLYWRCDQKVTQDFYSTVQLFSGERKIAQADQPLGTGSFPDLPSSAWQPGQLVKDTVVLQLPSTADAPLSLSALLIVYERSTGRRIGDTVLGLVPVTARAASVLPASAIVSGARVGTAVLQGYEIVGRELVLYWEAGAQMDGDGVVFIHLFDAQENFVAGADGRPRDGSYSTLAWQLHEGIIDAHRLPDVPAGNYHVKIGMYDAVTRVRFDVVDTGGRTAPDGLLPLGVVAVP